MFPQLYRWRDRSSGLQGRHPVDPALVQRAVKQAVSAAGVSKVASCHAFHHSFATHRLERGQDIRTAMTYTHGLNHGPLGVSSPAGFV